MTIVLEKQKSFCQVLTKPSSEANTVALKNSNIAQNTADENFSSKVNECLYKQTMTQDQCLDNGHQAASSTNDKTSDDPNKSKNSIFKSGINTAQEFNVDVNSERIDQQGADVLLVQNFALDTDELSTKKVITTPENLLDLTSNFANSTDNIDITASDNILAKRMTVITHQSSDENIREIISLPEDLNKIPNDSQINIECRLVNEVNYNKQNSNSQNNIRSENNLSNSNESDKPEDPIERLNKLRASISSALTEVKGVLKQYSTDQSLDGEPESAASSKPSDNGPVRFRFIRKIRRRSVFSEDIEDVIAQKNIAAEENALGTSSSSSIYKPGVEAFIAKEVSKLQNEESLLPIVSSDKSYSDDQTKSKNRDIESTNADLSVIVVPVLGYEEMVRDNKPIANEKDFNAERFPKTENLQKDLVRDNNNKENSSNLVTKKIKLKKENTNLNIIEKSPSDAVKTQKLKKNIKRDRRASAILENTPTELNLKPQRRPSDSGTIVKHPTKTKSKSSDKTKSNVEVSGNIKQNKNGESSVSKDQVSNKQDLESQKENTISNNCKFPKEDVSSNSQNDIVIQVTNISQSSNVANKLNDSLDVKALLEPSKVDEKNADSEETVSETHELVTQHKQVNKKCISNLHLSAEIAQKTNQKIIQETDVFLDLKANIEGDLTFNIAKDVPRPNSVKKYSEKEVETKEEQKNIITEPSNSTENKLKIEAENAIIMNEKLKYEIKDALNKPETKVENVVEEEQKPVVVEIKHEKESDNAALLKEELTPALAETTKKTKKKAKRKVVIRRIKRKLSKDDTFIQVQETPSELEIEEKEIEEEGDNDNVEEEIEVTPKQRKSCIKARQFEIGDIVMYAERYKKTQVKWRKATIIERITSISYKLDIDGEEKPAHISYIKKFTDRKVNFGGKEYLEIDYAQIEEDEEKERNYSIWNLA